MGGVSLYIAGLVYIDLVGVDAVSAFARWEDGGGGDTVFP